jgi:hypothetical protein
MTRRDQPDLFGDSQPELFAADAVPIAYCPGPDRVRARVSRILAEARRAETLPWDRARAKLYRTILPQMTLCLPDEEAARLQREFDEEMLRLEA